ncbi:MAG TPA: hypothetical protein DCE23_08495 [Firmicutes bacterium]|nr:hypothetical protein [Bacillota bacterium]
MVKFSIIVPVYNVEKYIGDCLDSILNQTYDNFEVIVVNDGSPDNSQDIIDKYVKKDKRIRSFIKKNGGLSDARNYGVSKAKGDYLVFVDSDDSINCELLEKINEVICEEVDIVRYQIVKIENTQKTIDASDMFENVSGEEAFSILLKNSWFVTAWSAAYRKEFWIKNKFNYAKGKIHEDFGLTPYVYMRANLVTSIDYAGYNYFVRENSIMTNNNKDKVIKKNEDCLFHYDRLMEFINKDKNVSNYGIILYKSYIANSLITRIKSIEDRQIRKDYVDELKAKKVGDNLISDTLPRKIKKIVYKVSPYLYIRLFVK